MDNDEKNKNVVENEGNTTGKNNLVKYDNDFILSSNCNQLSSAQQDIFFSAVSFLSRNKTEHIILPAAVIKKRANLVDKKYAKASYYKILHGLEEIILKTIFTVHCDGKEWKGTLFDTFAIDDKTGDFEMFLNPHAAHFFFQIPGPFSQFELQAFIGLNSKYAKNLFRVLIAKYNGRWNPEVEELINVFGLKNKTQLSMLTFRMPKYIDEILQTGYFEYIKYKTVRDDTKHGRPLKLINFEFNLNPKKKNELRQLSRWWGEQQLSDDEKSYICQSLNELDNQNPNAAKPEDNSESNEVDLRCPICGSKYMKSYNPKQSKDFWGHFDYAHSDCYYAKKTFDTIEELKEFIASEKEKEAQKERFKKLQSKNPIAIAAKKAADEEKANREKTKEELLKGSGLTNISEADIVLPSLPLFPFDDKK